MGKVIDFQTAKEKIEREDGEFFETTLEIFIESGIISPDTLGFIDLEDSEENQFIIIPLTQEDEDDQ